MACALYVEEYFEDSRASYEEAQALLDSEINDSQSRMTRVSVLLAWSDPQDTPEEVQSLLNEYQVPQSRLESFRFLIECRTKVGIN